MSGGDWENSEEPARFPVNRLVIGAVTKLQGSTFKLFEGNFSKCAQIVVKRAEIKDIKIATDEVEAMLELGHTGLFQRLLTTDRSIDHIFLAVERYETNCLNILLSVEGDVKDDFKVHGPLEVYNSEKIFRGALEGLDYLHKRGMVHRNVCAKNIAVHRWNDGWNGKI